MDKVKKFLEGYVEWVALALGVAFLGWMVYSYVILAPVAVPVGTMPAVTPGSIDSVIWDGPGKTLKGQIDAHTPPVKVAVKEFGDTIAKTFDSAPPDTDRLLNIWTAGVMPPLTPLSIAKGGTDDGHGAGPSVTALPIAPKPVNILFSTGHSNTLSTADSATGTAAAVSTGNGVPAAAAQPTDRAWVTVAVTVPSAALNTAFAQANIPTQGQLHQTTMLRVDLVREELDAAGNWGPDVVIAPLSIDALPAMPPATAKDINDARLQRSYLDFAGKDAPLILRPAFYQIAQGDKWYMPGAANPNVKAADLVEDKFDPATYTGSLDDLDKEQKDAVMKARRDAAALKAKEAAAAAAAQRQQAAAARAAAARSGGRSGGRNGAGGSGTTPPGMGPGGPGGGGGFVVDDPDRMANALLAQAAGRPNFMPPPMIGPDQPMPGTDMPGGMPQGDQGSTAIGGDLPKGSFDPATQKDFVVWAHDDTVKPGKTYRYRLRYTISSPVYATKQLCKPQTLAAQFAITSDWSDWSATVNVESDSNFYAAGISPKGSVTFDVFTWHSGIWQMETVNVDPGDTIGNSGWTVVDIRDIPNELTTNKLILLASENGTLERQVKLDKKNANYRKLLLLLKGPQQPTPGMQGQPGMPPMPGMGPGDPTPPPMPGA